jgi:hypothetical protein
MALSYGELWLIHFKFCVNTVQNLNFYISDLILYIVVKYKRIILNTILEHYMSDSG